VSRNSATLGKEDNARNFASSSAVGEPTAILFTGAPAADFRFALDDVLITVVRLRVK